MSDADRGAPQPNSHWQRDRRRNAAGWMATGSILLAAAAAMSVFGAGLGLGETVLGYRLQYLVVVLLVVGWMVAVGMAFNGKAEGLLIDGRNRISLSRLQLFVWLVIVGCAFAIEVAHNFYVGASAPDSVQVPPQLGLVMGFATASFVASPALLSLKSRKAPSPSEIADAHRSARDGSSLHPRGGRLYSRRPGSRARWSDLFRGEELETAGSADPAKVQQFLVTFMLATIYIAALWRNLAGPVGQTPFVELPGLSEGGLLLLGVSHAAYLGAKATPQTPGGATVGPGGDLVRIDTAPLPEPSKKVMPGEAG